MKSLQGIRNTLTQKHKGSITHDPSSSTGSTGSPSVSTSYTPKRTSMSPTLGATSFQNPLPSSSSSAMTSNNPSVPLRPHSREEVTINHDNDWTPSPSCVRKHQNSQGRRMSHLFFPGSRCKSSTPEVRPHVLLEVGCGRFIPLKQGFLHKKSSRLNKDWTKKFVCLTKDARLTYYPTFSDYINDVHGKEIQLRYSTIKMTNPITMGQQSNGSSSTPSSTTDHHADFKDTTSSPCNHRTHQQEQERDITPSCFPTSFSPNGHHHHHHHSNAVSNGKKDKDKTHKRRSLMPHRKSSHAGEDGLDIDFTIVYMEKNQQKEWRFQAESPAQKQEWVTLIEKEILTSLCSIPIEKPMLAMMSSVDPSVVQHIRTVAGNQFCADCNAPSPDWASLNLGILICIECSGSHRKLGSHVSKVRSLDLDDWPDSYVSVMMSLGNEKVNGVYEIRNGAQDLKAKPDWRRDDKETWIRTKYLEQKFLIPMTGALSCHQQLVDAILADDVLSVFLILSHSEGISQSRPEAPSKPWSNIRLGPLHLAATRGNLAICQLLLWSNIDINGPDLEGKTALYYAQLNKFPRVEQLLKQHGCTNPESPAVVTANGGSPSNGSSPGSRRNSLHINLLTSRDHEFLSKLPSSDI